MSYLPACVVLFYADYMCLCCGYCCNFFFFKQKTAYEMRISDWSSDVCPSDLLAPDLDTGAIDRFLSGRRPLQRLAIRHTVGMADALDGPGGLPAIATDTGCRHFKLKLGGDPETDRRRLGDIAAALDGAGIDYAATLDAHEQSADLAALGAICDALAHDPALAGLGRRLLYIEQPMPRSEEHTSELQSLMRISY